jgi:anti-repressor protein
VSELQVFAFEGAEVRTVTVDGEPWWVATDATKILGYRSASDATRWLDDDEKGKHSVRTPGGEQSVTVINEPGLYSLILRSKLPQAKAFKRWVTHEVIPAIRKTGRYEAAPPPPVQLSNRELARMVIEEADRADLAESRVRELEPSAQAWDVLASASGDFSLRDAAHILNRDPGISTGQQRLMKLIRALGMIDRNGIPYAKHSQHLTERPQTYRHPHTGEETLARPQIRITVPGLRYLHGKLGGVAPLRFEQLPLQEAG